MYSWEIDLLAHTGKVCYIRTSPDSKKQFATPCNKKMNSKENTWKQLVLWVVVRTNLVSPHYHIFSHLVGVRVFAFTQYKNTEKWQTYSKSGIMDSWLNRACPHHWWVCSHQNCNRSHPGMTWKGITLIFVSYVLHADAHTKCLHLTALPQSNCSDKGLLHRSFHLNYQPQNPITGLPLKLRRKEEWKQHPISTRTYQCTSPEPFFDSARKHKHKLPN